MLALKSPLRGIRYPWKSRLRGGEWDPVVALIWATGNNLIWGSGNNITWGNS